MMASLQNCIHYGAAVLVSAIAFCASPDSAQAIDLSSMAFVAPGVVQTAHLSQRVEADRLPRRQPYELKRIYRRYRTVFRTVEKGVDLSQELFGVETPGDTLRVRFRPTSANPDRMGGVVSCKVRF